MTEKLNYLEVKLASLDDYDYIEYYLEKNGRRSHTGVTRLQAKVALFKV